MRISHSVSQLLLLWLAGCSLAFVQAPPRAALVQPSPEIDCTESFLPAAIDTVAALAGAALIAVGAASLEDGGGAAVLMGTLVAVPFTFSARSGFAGADACRETRLSTANWRWLRERERQATRQGEIGHLGQECHLGPRPGDLECEGELACVRARCAVPVTGAVDNPCRILMKGLGSCNPGLRCTNGTCVTP
jgi:hypothetical protein